MPEKIGVIDFVEDDDYQGKAFKKVTLKGGEVLKVKYGREGYLKDKWGELQVGRAYTWTMGDYQGKPFVQDFTAVSEELAKKAIDDAPPTPISPQQKGMWWKEVGEMIRSGHIKRDTPVGERLYQAYFAQMQVSLEIDIKKEE